jgi:hypothetical protein
MQQLVADDLAAGASFSEVAQAHRINRVTVYRWIRTIPQFKAALDLSRAEFVIARRDDLQLLDATALGALMQILQNPKSSPSVMYKTVKMILERNKSKSGWCMEEPCPFGDGEAILNSAALDRATIRVPEEYILNHEEETVPEPAPETAPQPAQCNTMQHETAFSEPDVAATPNEPLAGDTAAELRAVETHFMERIRRMQEEHPALFERRQPVEIAKHRNSA